MCVFLSFLINRKLKKKKNVAVALQRKWRHMWQAYSASVRFCVKLVESKPVEQTSVMNMWSKLVKFKDVKSMEHVMRTSGAKTSRANNRSSKMWGKNFWSRLVKRHIKLICKLAKHCFDDDLKIFFDLLWLTRNFLHTTKHKQNHMCTGCQTSFRFDS